MPNSGVTRPRPPAGKDPKRSARACLGRRFFLMVGTLNDGGGDNDAVVDRAADALRSPLVCPRAARCSATPTVRKRMPCSRWAKRSGSHRRRWAMRPPPTAHRSMAVTIPGWSSLRCTAPARAAAFGAEMTTCRHCPLRARHKKRVEQTDSRKRTNLYLCPRTQGTLATTRAARGRAARGPPKELSPMSLARACVRQSARPDAFPKRALTALLPCLRHR